MVGELKFDDDKTIHQIDQSFKLSDSRWVTILLIENDYDEVTAIDIKDALQFKGASEDYKEFQQKLIAVQKSKYPDNDILGVQTVSPLNCSLPIGMEGMISLDKHKYLFK